MKGGARAIKGGPHARLTLFFLVRDLPVVHDFFPLPRLVHALVCAGPPLSLGSCARGPVSGLLVGDVDGRRSRAGCVVDLRIRTRSAGEGSPATREARTPGASTLAVVGAGRHDSTTTKGRSFLLFLYACCGAVSL